MQNTKFQSKYDFSGFLQQPTPRFTTLHPALRGSRAENKNLKTKEPKGQRINPIPQAAPIHPERNEQNSRSADTS